MGRTAALIGGSLFVGAGLWTVFGPTLLAAISPKQVDEKQHLHSGRPRQELPAVKRLLSDDQVHRILTAKQATLDPADGRTPAPAAPAVLGKLPAVRIDVNSVASNSPIEDYHSQVVVDSGLLVGVFDGHGGPECGKIVSKFLLPYVAKAIKDAAPPKESGPERHKAIKTAIRTAFETLDNDIVNGAFTVAGDGSVVKTDATFATWALGLPGFNRTHVLDSLRTAAAGSCAVVAYLDGDDVYVACTGDCRAVLGRRVDYNSGGAGVSYIATPLSTDQTAKNPSEYARIQEEHPGEDVIIRGRVLGGLMPTRAFGDARYKWPAFAQQFIIPHLYEDGRRGMPRNYRTPPYVTAMPEVIHYRRDTNDSFLVLATDGLWDAVTNDLCVEVVGQQIRPPVAKQELLSNANAATALVRSALSDGDLVPDPERVRHILSIPPRKSRHYRDDITVNVVFFDSVANAVATPSAVAAAAGSTAKSIDTVNLALASPKKHYLSSWQKPPAQTSPLVLGVGSSSTKPRAAEAPSKPAVDPTKPRPIVLCGPSGTGKSTLLKRLFAEHPEKFGFSVSHTSRKPRAGETDGVEYHFLEREKLKQLIAEGKFVESAEFSGNIYGTSFKAVQDVLEQGKNVILDIDMQGVIQLQQRVQSASSPFSNPPLYIFIAPPSMAVLEKRLKGRGTETEESASKRLEAAKREMDWGLKPGSVDVVIVNDSLETAYESLRKATLG
nr:hypothetical protein HK105_005977 [Polyrhizophydium stewartii]